MLNSESGCQLDPHKISRRVKKLSPGGKSLVSLRILAGDSNAQIIALLKARGFLALDDDLTDRQLYYYRASPQMRLSCSLLTAQAREACLRELSEGVVGLSDMAQEARHRLRQEGEQLPSGELKNLLAIQAQAVRLSLSASGHRGI